MMYVYTYACMYVYTSLSLSLYIYIYIYIYICRRRSGVRHVQDGLLQRSRLKTQVGLLRVVVLLLLFVLSLV